jgi:hypothetical protein
MTVENPGAETVRLREFIRRIDRMIMLRRRVWLVAYLLPTLAGMFLITTPLPLLRGESAFAHVLLSLGSLVAWLGAVVRRPVLELPGASMTMLLLGFYGATLLAYGIEYSRPGLIGFGLVVLFGAVAMIGRLVEVWNLPTKSREDSG